MPPDPPRFASIEDLAGLLDELGMRLHARNRMALGESGFYWHLAETLRSLGQMVDLPRSDAAIDRKFGNGDRAGEIPGAEQTDAFLDILRQQRP